MSYTVEDIARVCHEANRVLQVIHQDPGIPLAPQWDEWDEISRQGVIEGVTEVLGGATPEESHDSWRLFKVGHGWVYGPVKSDIKKTHPCLVPYGELSEEQKDKDRLFHAIVTALG